ncbi:amidohydrolase family protein [Aestuariivirga sp.]|uniref:amidohydrolase family protein n=1 Tax=Aestuariivirga sp. TaxID=2650926 RepID=UPI003BAC1B6F
MIPIVDAHHHIWRQNDVPWLQGAMVPRIFGPYESIRRDYPIAEYMSDITGCGVEKSVYVQVNWARDQALAEARWVQDVAHVHGWPHAIVGYADLLSDEAPATLAALAQFPAMRGVRMQLHWHENPMYRFASAPDLMNGTLFRKNFAYLKDNDLSFDLQVFTPQMPDAASLASQFHGTTFILQHAGMLEDTSASGRARWKDGMRRLADQPNIVAKLSGLGTFIHGNDPAHIADVVGETIEIFGSGRCLFGSNFPIEKIWTDYPALVSAYRAALSHVSGQEQAAILNGNATRIYRL